MTQPKTLSPAEALRALADGKKLTCDEFSETSYVELSRQGCLVNEAGEHFPLHNFEEFTEYTEPRPKRKVAPYIVQHRSDRAWMTLDFWETEEELLLDKPKVTILRRVTELEVELEG